MSDLRASVDLNCSWLPPLYWSGVSHPPSIVVLCGLNAVQEHKHEQQQPPSFVDRQSHQYPLAVTAMVVLFVVVAASECIYIHCEHIYIRVYM